MTDWRDFWGLEFMHAQLNREHVSEVVKGGAAASANRGVRRAATVRRDPAARHHAAAPEGTE